MAYKNLYDEVEGKKIILHNGLSLGDILVMEAAIESLHKLYPGKYVTGVDTPASEVFQANPYVEKLEQSEAEFIKMNYTDGINNCDKRPIHFMQAYCDMLGKHLKIDLPCVVKAPKLYLSDEEKGWINQVQETFGWKGKFWILGAASWKSDYTIKKYYKDGLQEVIDYFKGKILFVQVGAEQHNHYALNNVINLTGKTDNRQLIRLCYWASGGLALESFLHHAMAAFNKPCVTLASGFLPVSWVNYPFATILTNQGKVPCSMEKGCCWKSRVVPLGDSDSKDHSLCELPILGEDAVAKCMYMIEPAEIITAIEKYYEGGILTY